MKLSQERRFGGKHAAQLYFELQEEDPSVGLGRNGVSTLHQKTFSQDQPGGNNRLHMDRYYALPQAAF